DRALSASPRDRATLLAAYRLELCARARRARAFLRRPRHRRVARAREPAPEGLRSTVARIRARPAQHPAAALGGAQLPALPARAREADREQCRSGRAGAEGCAPAAAGARPGTDGAAPR